MLVELGLVEQKPRVNDRRARLDHIAFVLSESALSLMETIDEVSQAAATVRPYRRRLRPFGRLAAIAQGALDMGRAARDGGEAYLVVLPVYAELTGVGRDQARHDMLFVQDRLSMCASGVEADTALVHQVARRLVRSSSLIAWSS